MMIDDLEQAFRERQGQAGERLVILAMQLPESDVRSLRPYLAHRQLCLSEYVRALILENKRRYIP